MESGDYESTDVARDAMQLSLLLYARDIFVQDQEEGIGGQQQFQIATMVDAVDSTLGHALVVRPVQDSETGIDIEARYFTVNRETQTIVGEPFVLGLELVPGADDEAKFEESGEADSADYARISDLLRHAYERNHDDSGEIHPIDREILLTLQENYLGNLATMYPEVPTGSNDEKVRETLDAIFENGSRLVVEGVLALQVQDESEVLIVEKEEFDYNTQLFDPSTGKLDQYAIGPNAENWVLFDNDSGIMELPDDAAVARIEDVLIAGSELSEEDYEAVNSRLEDIREQLADKEREAAQDRYMTEEILDSNLLDDPDFPVHQYFQSED
jgi:hypothetical protein